MLNHAVALFCIDIVDITENNQPELSHLSLMRYQYSQAEQNFIEKRFKYFIKVLCVSLGMSVI